MTFQEGERPHRYVENSLYKDLLGIFLALDRKKCNFSFHRLLIFRCRYQPVVMQAVPAPRSRPKSSDCLLSAKVWTEQAMKL